MKANLIKRILAIGLALLGLVGAEAFAQATTATVTVNATVTKACRFQTSTATLVLQNDGGTLVDPSIATNATGSVPLTYRCTNGTAPLFDIDTSGTLTDPKVRVVTLTGAGSLPTQITVAGSGNGTGMGSGGDKTATVSGLINYTPDIESAAVGAYTKDVTITIQAQ